MRILIIYDSKFGNTKKVALQIKANLSKTHEVDCVFASDFFELSSKEVEDYNCYVLGTPTHGGQASEGMSKVLAEFTDATSKEKCAACFDTRSEISSLNIFLRILVRIIGYASPKMVNFFENKGFQVAISAQGFEVVGREGPLLPDQYSKIDAWSKQLSRNLK